MPVRSVLGQGGPGVGEEVPELLLVPPQGCRTRCYLGWDTAPKRSPTLKQQFVFAAEFQVFQANFPKCSLAAGWGCCGPLLCTQPHTSPWWDPAVLVWLSQGSQQDLGAQSAPPSLLPDAGTVPVSPVILSAQLGQLMLSHGAPRLHS